MTMTKARLGLILSLLVLLLPRAGLLAEPPGREPTDRSGDPLPAGALTRLGSIRLRHGGHAYAVAFTPDGKSLISGGFDGWAFQWDLQSGKRLRAFHGGAIHSLVLDPQGKRLALGFTDGRIRLCELATGKELADCAGHPSGTRVVVFSPDGKRLASLGNDKRRMARPSGRRPGTMARASGTWPAANSSAICPTRPTSE